LYVSANNGDVWTPGNASGLGIVLSVAADPTRAPMLFVGGADGTVLFSDNEGLSFSTRSNGLPRENIVSLTTAPWDKTYAISGSGGLYATSDNGLNWFAAGKGVSAPAIALAADPVRSWILYLGTSGGGIYKSESGSLTWAARNRGLTSPYVFSVAVDPSTPTTVYAGTLGGVFKSLDGAASWAAATVGLPPGPVTALQVDSVAPAVIYASVQNAGLFRSDNRGATWSPVSSGLNVSGAMPLLASRTTALQLFRRHGAERRLPVEGTPARRGRQSSFGMTLFVRGLAVDPTTPSTVYAGSLGAGVFKSTDAAATWTNIGLRDRNIFKLAVDPANPAIVYAATSQGISRSTDAGANWKSLGQRAAYVHAMVVDPRDRRRVFVGTTAGAVYRSTDGGDAWELAALGLPPYTVFALAIDPADGTLYAALERHGIWRSANLGTSWAALPAGALDRALVSALAVGTGHDLYAASVGSGVFAHRNGAWTIASDGLATAQISDVAIGGDGVMYARDLRSRCVPFDQAERRDLVVGRQRAIDEPRVVAHGGIQRTRRPSTRPHRMGIPILNRGHDVAGAQHRLARHSDLVGDAQNTRARPFGTLRPTAARVFRSTDAGASWLPMSRGLVNLDVRRVAAGAENGALAMPRRWAAAFRVRVTAQRPGRVASPSICGGQLRAGAGNRSHGHPPRSMPPPRATVCSRAPTAGSTGPRSTTGSAVCSFCRSAIDRQHPSTLYAGTTDSGVYVTTDAGASWHSLNQVSSIMS
jgi:photosystem II stability/assembly factor-like uncharacterized protein